MEEQNEDQETARIKELQRYAILNTLPDESFDRFTRMAAGLFAAPISIISFVDSDRIWFKSAFGLSNVSEVDRYPGLCASVILGTGPYIVEDALRDPRTLTNPLVTGSFGLRFYAGVPLRTKKGFNLGSLSIIDTCSRSFEKHQATLLEDLRDMLMDYIELQHAKRMSRIWQEQIVRFVAHDLKNPLTVVSIQAQLMKMATGVTPEILEASAQLSMAAKKMTNTIDELLQLRDHEPEAIKKLFPDKAGSG